MRRTKPTITCRQFRKSTPLCHLRLEPLEDRSLPSILTVANTADNGTGSLRAALAASADGDTIVFALPKASTIHLTSGALNVDRSVTISGPGPTALTIQGNNADRVFVVNAPADISGITITGGVATSGNGGGIDSLANLTLINCVLVENGTVNGSGGGIAFFGGQLSMISCTVNGNHSAIDGGGIEIAGLGASVSIEHSVIASNTCGHNAGGVDIFSSATTTITDSSISGNVASQYVLPSGT